MPPHPGGRLPIDRDLELREPRQLFRAQVCSPVHAFDELFGLFGQSRQLVEVRAENPHRQVRRCPPEPFVNTHAEGRREQHRDARESLEPLTHVVLDVFDAAASVGLQNDENVGECMWHRVFRALGSPSASHHILDLRHVPQNVLDAVIQPIHLLESSLWWKDRLQQQRALIELGREIRADAQRECHGWHGDHKRDEDNDHGMSEATVERRRVPSLDPSQKGNVCESALRSFPVAQRRFQFGVVLKSQRRSDRAAPCLFQRKSRTNDVSRDRHGTRRCARVV